MKPQPLRPQGLSLLLAASCLFWAEGAKATAQEAIVTLKGETWIRSINFSPDGKLLAIGGGGTWGGARPASCGAFVLEAANGRVRARFGNPKLPISQAAFWPDGNTLATMEMGFSRNWVFFPRGNMKLWDVRTGKQTPFGAQRHTAKASCVAFSPDGKTIAVSEGSFQPDHHPP